MKKWIAGIVVLTMLCAFFADFACAESGTQIKFRDIEWYTKYADVNEHIGLSEGYVMDDSLSIMEDIDENYSNIRDDNYNMIDGMGVEVIYNNVDVAGYSASPSLYCIYSIVDGATVMSADEAELYMAKYTIDGYADMVSVYIDLKEKLTSVYGNGIPRDVSYNEECTYWQDESGNELLLSRSPFGRVVISYAANDHREHLKALKKVRLAEIYKTEAEERTKNAGDTSGL